jgi:predicted AlkP superfamily phosphohydrolase/phosphomutase
LKTHHASILASVLLVLLLVALDLSPAEGQAPTRAIVLSWDGAVPELINDLLLQGKLPNLAKLIAEGAFGNSVITAFPAQTAPGHASLWTGAPPRITGITGYRVPRTPRHTFTILESVSGLNSPSLRAEPLWMAAVRSGRRAIVVQAAQAWPFEPYVTDSPPESSRILLFEGYAGILGRDGVITAQDAVARIAAGWTNLPQSTAPPREINFTIGTTRLFGLFIDDPADPLRGYNTLIVTRVKDGRQVEARLKPGDSKPGSIDKWSSTVEVEAAGHPRAGVFMRLFELKADGSDFLLYFTRPVRGLSSRPELLPALRKAAGVFVGNGASNLYRQGAFGPSGAHGGSGSAERRYLETMLLTQRQLMDTTRWAVQNLPWDLLITYTPYPDEAEHLWLGYLDPHLPGFRKDVAGRLQPFLEEAYRTCDEFLGLLMKLRPPNTVIALVSDHGMEGVNKAVLINTALQRAGLLVFDQRGQVDLTRTKALYPPMNGGYILINTRDRKRGIVGPEERAQVVSKIRRVLQEIRDEGRQVVTGIFDSETEGEVMGIGGEAGGDIYLDLLPGYDFDGRLDATDLITRREPSGAHSFNPLRMSMRTIMVLNGPGVAVGQRLGKVRTIDFAPTLAKLLGIPAPRHASGRVLLEALTPH